MVKIYLFASLLLLCNIANSQTVNQKLISASQKSVVTNEFSYSWSVGETVIASDNIQVSPGYHSEATIFITPITSNKDVSQSSLIKYYPNPSSRFLYVDMSQLEDSNYIIMLYDLKGSEMDPPITSDDLVKKIDLYELETGMYQLHIIDSKTKVIIKQFKVIKR